MRSRHISEASLECLEPVIGAIKNFSVADPTLIKNPPQGDHTSSHDIKNSYCPS